jgi:hypothetical protein
MDNIVDRADVFAVRIKQVRSVFGRGKISQDSTPNLGWLERFISSRETNGIGKSL